MNKTASAAYAEARLLAQAASRPAGSLTVRYAKLFAASYEGDVYVVTDALGRRVLAVPRGLPQGLAAYYREKYMTEVVVEYPVRGAVLMSSTAVAMAYHLYAETGRADVLRSIAGIMWGREYDWFLPEVKALLENGTIADVGPAYSPNFERIAALRPDVVFVYFYPGPYGTEAVINRLAQMGVPYVVVNEFQEVSPPSAGPSGLSSSQSSSTPRKTPVGSPTRWRPGGAPSCRWWPTWRGRGWRGS